MWLILACTPADEPAQHAAPGRDMVTDTASAEDSGSPAAADLDTFEAMVAGDIAVDAGFGAVSRSGGWPIATEDGFLFARPDDGRGLALAGDFSDWEALELDCTGGVCWTLVAIDEPAGQLYKFTAGAAWEEDPWSRAYGYDDNGTYSLVRGLGGHLERLHAVGGDGVEARTIRLWVPVDPVTHQIYVHDGQNLFDPDGPWGAGGWDLQLSLGPSTLAVGVDNSDARMDEYTHVEDLIHGTRYGGGAGAFDDYVLEVVRPLVETVHGTADRVGVMGSSLGGLLAIYQQLHTPEAWDFVASMSGTLSWGSFGLTNPTVIDLFADEGGVVGSAVIYVDSGGTAGQGCVDSDSDGIEDDGVGSTDNYCPTRQFVDQLASQGYTWDVDLIHWWEDGADHSESAWRDRVWRPLEVFEAL